MTSKIYSIVEVCPHIYVVEEIGLGHKGQAVNYYSRLEAKNLRGIYKFFIYKCIYIILLFIKNSNIFFKKHQ